MNYVGIEIHKRYSVLAAQDEEGRKLKEARSREIRPRTTRAFSKVWKGAAGKYHGPLLRVIAKTRCVVTVSSAAGSSFFFRNLAPIFRRACCDR